MILYIRLPHQEMDPTFMKKIHTVGTFMAPIDRVNNKNQISLVTNI